MMKYQINILVLSTFLFIALSSCNKSKEGGEGALTGEVKIDGSSTVYPISEAMAEEYRVGQPEVRVTVGLSGTGGGFKKFCRSEIDINNASRSIKEEEVNSCGEAKVNYVELPVAYDGLAVVVNPENDWVKEITVAELKKIWEPEAQGKITRWNQIRPEWPNEEIHLYGAGVESGTYDYFTEAIVGKSHSSRGDYTASEDDNVLVQGISGDKFGLGFFGLAYFSENKDKLKLVPVDDQNDANGKGPITPTLETVKNNTYAPLSRPLFIYVNSTSAERKEVVDFVNFYLENVGILAEQIGFIPMEDKEYEEAKVKFTNFVSQKAQ
ncbi:MAG TPA: PstS family phosphate ABC transporter substrate-binding protein [Cytophagales bacterium]|nr:PstS family phosphate ABC transporter substrate-binding protein [Cytophagales bacterium]